MQNSWESSLILGRRPARLPLANNFSFSMADRLAVGLLRRAHPQRLPLFPSPCTFSLCRSYFATPSVQAGSVKKRMPPKKAAQPEKKILLGRPSNNLKIGIVGLFGLSSPELQKCLTPFSLYPRRSPKRRKIVLLQRALANRCVTTRCLFVREELSKLMRTIAL